MMRKEIFSFALITVLVMRAWLGILTGGIIESPVFLNGLRWHHFYTGLVIIFLGFFVASRQLPRSILFGIGIGLIIDELTLPLNPAGYDDWVYWSAPSVVALAIGLSVLYFLTRERNN